MDLLIRLLALVRKELLVVLKDPANRVILIVPAIVQSMIFGYAATYDLSRVPYALVDHSRSLTSSDLVARLDGSGLFRRTHEVASEHDASKQIDDGEVMMIVTIPPDFEARVLGGDATAVQILLDARNSTTAGTAAADVAQVVERFNRERAQRAGQDTPVGVEVQTRAWFNPNLETRWNFMPGLIASLSMLQTLLLTALSVAREREQGTFDQLLVTPLSPVEILIGKAVTPVLVGLVQSTLIMLITRFWFGVPMAGGLGSMYAALATFTIASVGIGLSVSAVAASMQQAMLYTFVLVMPMMLLSGLSTPVANMPEVLQAATYVNPLRFGIDAVRRIYLEGAGLGAVATDFIPLLAIAAVTLPTAAWLFRHRLV